MFNKIKIRYGCILILCIAFIIPNGLLFGQHIPGKFKDVEISNPAPTDSIKETVNAKNFSDLNNQIADAEGFKLRDAIHEYWISRFLTSPEFILCCALLVFTLILFYIFYLLFRTKLISPNQISRMSIITLIVIGTLFLITAGYDKEQILSAMGLFGTIAGYILGKSSSQSTPSQVQNNPPQHP